MSCAVADVADDQRDVLDVVERAAVADGAEVAERGGQAWWSATRSTWRSCAAAVADQVGDRDHDQAVLVGERAALRARASSCRPRSSARTARPTGVRPASRARSTAASVCPARRSTPPGTARSGMTCPGRVRSHGLGGGVGEHLDGVGAVGGRDAGGLHVAGVDGDGVGRLLAVLVDRRHGRQARAGRGPRRAGHADVARGVPDHEGGQLRRSRAGRRRSGRPRSRGPRRRRRRPARPERGSPRSASSTRVEAHGVRARLAGRRSAAAGVRGRS